ncbi:MAG: hypothetical protein KDC24_14025, partial [Saprospiraceae bacterium]|nr:hypothetical protein [Saprospiraceae bacterium]
QSQWGIKGGAILSDFNNFGKNRIFKIEETQVLDLYFGPSIGVVYKNQFKENWAIQGEARVAYQFGMGEFSNEPDFFFITLPMVVDRKIYKFVHAQAGLALNVLLEQPQGTTLEFIDENLDVLALGGFEFELSPKFQVGIRAGIGLRPLAKLVYTNAEGEINRESVLRENQLSLHGTYFF